jgi:hypothetical protein
LPGSLTILGFIDFCRVVEIRIYDQGVEVLFRFGGLRMIESNAETPTIPALRAKGTQ